jgi:flagellar basal body rod protein FlgC
MLPALTIASNALQVQSQKLNAIASSVAAQGVMVGNINMRRYTVDIPQVRIGSLPVGDEVDNLMSLKDVELAYRMNATVISTANEMAETLLDAVHPDER